MLTSLWERRAPLDLLKLTLHSLVNSFVHLQMTYSRLAWLTYAGALSEESKHCVTAKVGLALCTTELIFVSSPQGPHR